MPGNNTWKKSPQELIDHFHEELDACGLDIERRKMFGYPCAFTHKNMFTGLHEDRWVLRLPEKERNQLLDAGAKHFEPIKGRIMKEYIIIPPEIIKDHQQLHGLLMISLHYAQSLPPKEK